MSQLERELEASIEQIRKERLMNTSAELDRIAEESVENANKQAELVNLTFTILSVELVSYEYQGEQRQSYVGVVSRDGQEDDRFWLSGSILRRQIDFLVKEQKFPMRVKLIRDADRNGSPYVLKGMMSENGASAAARAATPSDADLIANAVMKVGIDEVVLALGDLSKVIMVAEDGGYVLVTKGLSLPDAATIRKTLMGLAG